MSSAPRPLALFGVSLGYFMVLLDMTVLSVAEPDLAASLHSSVPGLQWVITSYTVVFGALLLSAGAVADRYGAHRVFLAGIAVFGAGSLLCALAPNVGTLVGLRALLGAAAAAVVPASMAMITQWYPQPARRAQAVAVWAAISGAALPTGPVLGGLLVDLAGWRAIFLINVPLAGITMALTAARATGHERDERRVDWPGQALACLALGLLTDALIAVGSGGRAHAGLAALGAAVAGGLFIVRERRSSAPVLVQAVVQAPGMRPALLAAAAVNVALSGLLFVLPLLLAYGRDLTPIQVGLAFLPMTVPFAVNPLLTGRVVARVGPRPPIRVGLALLATAGFALAVAVRAGAPYPLLAVGLFTAGFGVSFALPALAAAVVTAAPAGTAGAAGGLLNAVRQGGASVGVAVLGAFVTVGGTGRAALALALCGSVCAAALPGLARRAPR
jgi:MFS transporter, DHA2 family, methylenomycin A resistance protein